MRHGRTLLLAISSAAAHRSALETCLELARAYRLPVRGLVVEEQAALDLSALPTTRLGPPTNTPSRQMEAALVRWSRTVTAEVEGQATRARIQTSLDVRRGALMDTLGNSADTGDLVVMPIDLSEPRLGRMLGAAAALARRTAGVLLVPETRRSPSGAVIARAESENAPLAMLARDIAESLGAPLAVLPPGQTQVEAEPPLQPSRAGADRNRRTARLVVAPPHEAEGETGAALVEAMRRDRPSLLLVEPPAAEARASGDGGR